MAVIVQQNPRESQLRRSEDECSVFFKFINGKTLCMMVNPNHEDIYTIKQRLSELAMTSECPSFVLAGPDDIFLIWSGKPLDDSCVLADYNINKTGHATVFCYERKRGGCFAISFSILTVILASIIGSTCTCGISLVMVPLLLPLLLILPFFCL